jgi:hypothetical protein
MVQVNYVRYVCAFKVGAGGQASTVGLIIGVKS